MDSKDEDDDYDSSEDNYVEKEGSSNFNDQCKQLE